MSNTANTNTAKTSIKSSPTELAILALLLDGPKTRAELGIHASGDHYYMIEDMKAAGLIKTQPRKTGRVGRPADEIDFAKKGRDRARSKAVQELADRQESFSKTLRAAKDLVAA